MADSLLLIHNKVAAWDEVADSQLSPEHTIVFFWRQNRPEQLQKSLDRKFNIVLCPRLPMYLDYAQDTLQVHGVDWRKFSYNSYQKVYSFSPQDIPVKYPKNCNILGIQANLWTERIETEDRLDYMLFPRMAALAENAWTKEKNKNINSFNIRLKNNLIYIRKIISTIQILLPLKRPENQLDKINNQKMNKINIYTFLFCTIFLAIGCYAQQASYPKSKILQKNFSSNLKDQLRELEKDSFVQYLNECREKWKNNPYRPIYHFSSPESILHDPNGLCYWQGNWHLFYQYLPSKDFRQHWGHAVSHDLIHWKDLPIALYPSPENMCYSGATLAEKDKVIAMYYGVDIGDIVATSSDPLLLNWEKVATPAIPRVKSGETLPYYVFDPAIWKEDSIYYAVTGGRTNTGPGNKAMRSTSLFSSKDLKNWKYEHNFMKNECFLPPGEDASCPYFWPIGNRYIFLFFSHTTGSQYLLGDYNKEEHCFYPTFHGRFNFMSFLPGGVHAPSATSDGKGGVIVIHNMHTGKKSPGWRGITTLPRKLTLDKCDTINIQPYGDYKSLRTHHQHIDKTHLPANKEIIIDNIQGNALEIKAEINIKSSPMIEMNVLRSPDKEEFTSIKFFKDRGVDLVRTNPALKNQRWGLISLETAHSSILPDVISRAPELAPVYLKPNETLKLHIFIDKSIIEIFVNDKQVVTTRVYPGKKESIGISLKSQGRDATLISMDAWQMKSIYKELQNDFIK